jgi:hypothetical protein
MGEVVKLNEWQGHAQSQARLPAVIRTSGAQSVAGTVTELSVDGACIEVPPVPLPGFFLLEIAGGKAVERICRVVWRDERRLSVRFVNARTMGRSRARCPKAPAEAVALYAESRSTLTAASNSARR